MVVWQKWETAILHFVHWKITDHTDWYLITLIDPVAGLIEGGWFYAAELNKSSVS